MFLPVTGFLPAYLHIFRLIIVLAFFIDLLLGDPRWLPHPVVLMGRLIELLERFFRLLTAKPLGEKFCGIFLVAILVVLTFFFSWGIIRLFSSWSNLLGYLMILYFLSTTLSLKGLQQHVKNVEGPLQKGDLDAARRALSLIVGRDTAFLSEKGIIKAAAESLAENVSDGVIAPLFYAFLGGAPLAMAYKAVNTLDSMLGYQNERYHYFGWAAARLDDLASYVPARLTAFLLLLAAFLWGKITFREAKKYFQIVLQEGKNHPSPNSGYPEAAAAVLLNISLGGANRYGGILSDRPVIFAAGQAPELDDLKNLRALIFKASLLTLFSGISALTIYSIFV